MSLTRKLLESLGIEADKVSTIIEAHAETVDALKGQIETYKADAEKYATTKKELDTAQTELETLKTQGGDWESKYNKEHDDFEAFKANQSAKDELASKDKAYRKLLLDSGISDKRIDAIMKVTDLKAITLGEDGQIQDADNLKETIKGEWADFVTTTQTEGATTITPPANNNIQRYSHEDIAKMTSDEINANWDTIKLSMKGNE